MAFSSISEPNSSPTNNPNNQQKECYIMRSSNYNLKITFSKPNIIEPSLNKKQPEVSMVDPPGDQPKRRYRKRKASSEPKMNNKKPKESGKLLFVDHDDAIKATIIEHVKRNFGYNEVSDVKIIMEKKMTQSDTEPKQARLAIPAGSANKLDASFLTHDEKELLKNKEADINVKVIVGMSVYDMPLSRWNYYEDEEKKKNNNNKNPGFKYVLKTGLRHQWSKLRENHGLQKDDYILLATFRHNNLLHFVIIKAKPVMVFGTAIGRKYSMD